VHITEGLSSTQRVWLTGHASRRRERLQRMEKDGVVPRRRDARGRYADVEPQVEHEHEPQPSLESY